MPFYIRHSASAVIWRVYVVEVDSEEDAGSLTCLPLSRRAKEIENKEGADLGYYRDEMDLPFFPKVFGPFATREEAENSDKAWVEDV